MLIVPILPLTRKLSTPRLPLKELVTIVAEVRPWRVALNVLTIHMLVQEVNPVVNPPRCLPTLVPVVLNLGAFPLIFIGPFLLLGQK